MYDKRNEADFEAEADRSDRRERRLHGLERRVKQLEAQVESLLAAYATSPSFEVNRQQMGFEWVVSGERS